MPSPISKELGRKPYINTKGIDGGYVNEMRRTTQSVKEPLPAPLQKRSRGAVIDAPGVALAYGLISMATLTGVSWGLTFDVGGGLYYSINGGDIYYNHVALGQTSRGWETMACSPITGDIYAAAFTDGIFIRAGGTGDFTLLDAGTCQFLDAAANGDVYAIMANKLYKRTGGAGTFDLVAGITSRSYSGLACAPNGDLYATGFDGASKVYVRTGGAGDLVELQTIASCRSLTAAPNGDIYLAPYTAFDFNLYQRAGGAGSFEVYFDVARATQDMAVSPAGVLYLSSTYFADNQIYMLNTTTTVPPAKDTISQTHAAPERTFAPRFQNLKPYENQTYEGMQTQARSINYAGREQKPAPEGALPVLVGNIDEVFRYVRSGSPVVIDIPTDSRDPVSGVEIYARVDGFASVAPNGTSVIYNPGTSGNALLTVHTKSGQQCTVSLMAK